MKQTVIIYTDDYKKNGEPIIEGGIYNNIARKAVDAEILADDLVLYLPLTVSGKTYAERKEDLRGKAIEWSIWGGEFQAWSYGELATIQSFFEEYGRKYGLFKEFRENGII